MYFNICSHKCQQALIIDQDLLVLNGGYSLSRFILSFTVIVIQFYKRAGKQPN